MPPKKRINLPDHVREAVLDDVQLSYREAQSADERYKIRIHLAIVQGMTTYEIADFLGVSQSVVSKWSREGEQARDRRRLEDLDRSGELAANS